MKISKRTREDAILICAIAASGGVYLDRPILACWSPLYDQIRDALDLPRGAMHLAIRMYSELMRSARRWSRDLDAEAAQLLREGWTS